MADPRRAARGRDPVSCLAGSSGLAGGDYGRLLPGLRTPARRAHEHVLARPRDVRRGADEVAVRWVKRRWKYDEQGCARKTFTEWVPQIPP